MLTALLNTSKSNKLFFKNNIMLPIENPINWTYLLIRVYIIQNSASQFTFLAEINFAGKGECKTIVVPDKLSRGS